MFCMNDILLPAMVENFHLNYFQATMIQFSFYVTYIIWPLPIAFMIHKYGYRISLLVALLLCASGCLLVVPARIFGSYAIVLSAIFILSTGITVVNVAANPFVVLLGDKEGAHIRMNFVQVFSRIGYAFTPVLATALIYSSKTEGLRFHFPYALIAMFILVIGILIFFSAMPLMKAEKGNIFSVKDIFKEVRRYPYVIFGVFAMFFYVGAEACTAGFFIPYLQNLGFTPARASRYLTLYYVFAATTGLTAVFILRYIKAHVLVGIYGSVMVTIYFILIFFNTGNNEFLLAGLGLFLGIMFPTLFSLGIEDVESFSGKASALLNFAIVGGAFFSPVQGAVTDRFGVKFSYLVPCFCFIMITIYAFFFTRTPLMRRAR